MPTYTIRNKKNGKTKELFMSISEMLKYEKDHPNEEVLCGAPLIHSGTGLGVIKSAKADEGFKDKLREIAKRNPGNTMGDYTNF